MPRDTSQDEALLSEIRENFTRYAEFWREIHEEGETDIKYLAGDPWTDEEKKDREAADRPLFATDELNQYVNQLINNVRQNKRSIRVVPVGSGANDKLAELRQNIIRAVEYKSNAQAAYTTAFENAAQRGYGFFRINLDWVGKGFAQELVIRRIPNPDTVLMDPDCKQADRSDAEGCFVIDSITTKNFARKYPKAEKKSFNAEDLQLAPEWVKGDLLQLAEYWKVKKTYKTLLLLDDQGTTGYLEDYEDAKLEKVGENEVLVMADGARLPIYDSRECEERKVVQYITNGFEILEENPWPGSYIPIIGVYGKEMYVTEDGSAKLMLFSLIRLARDPYKLYCYYRTKEAEEAAMTPVAPFVGYAGQFEKDPAWETANKIPVAYLEVEPMVDTASGQILPLPQRQPFVPNFQTYEIAAEAARRAIQSACGISPLPTAAQRRNEKSGVALERMEQQASQGSYHFIDNQDRGLENAGRQLNELIPIVTRGQRDIPIRKPDETHAVVRANDPNYQENGKQVHYDTQTGEFDVTISTGPSTQSQREEVNAFGDILVGNIQTLPIPEPTKAALMAQVIRMKNLGPLGDEMAELLSPKGEQEMPPQAMQALAKMKQEMTQLNAACQEYEKQIAELKQEKQGKVIENMGRLEIEKLKAETSVAVAEINTKAQAMIERMTVLADIFEKLNVQQHEREMQGAQLEHDAAQGDVQRGHEAAIGAANAAQAQQQAQMEQAQPEGA
jgi:hypothetical protein